MCDIYRSSSRKLVSIINATAAAKCQFVQPHPRGFLSAPQFERQSFFLGDGVLWKWTRCSLPAPFIISLSLLQLNELFRKSAAHKDFMSVRVRNLAPSNSILAFVEAHFNPGERPLKTASPVAFICASVVVCSPLSLFKSDNFKKILLDLNEIGHES